MTACRPWLPTSAAAGLTLRSPASIAVVVQADTLPDSNPSAKIRSGSALVAVGVGVNVGVDEGPTVGVFVGVSEGPAVAVNVGVDEGPTVGVSVGVDEGPTVGVLEGVAVGPVLTGPMKDCLLDSKASK